MNPQAGIAGTSALYKFNASPNTRAVVSQKCRVLTPAYGSTDGLLYQIGVVASFSISGSSRSAEPYRGVGFGDQIAELVPGVSDPHEASFTRTLLYLSNAHQAFGYAGGVDGPVRTLQQHRWPFDIEQQLVFSTIADTEAPATGVDGLVDVDFTSQNASQGVGSSGALQEGVEIDANGAPGAAGSQKHKALITYCEGCWITAMDHGEMSADGGIIQQSVTAQITDVHDLYSTYGEFMATGNDPTLGQNSSILYNERATTATNRSTGASATGVATAPVDGGDAGAGD